MKQTNNGDWYITSRRYLFYQYAENCLVILPDGIQNHIQHWHQPATPPDRA
jgi:hypothetical protein